MKKKLLTFSAVLLLLVTLAFSASASGIKEFKTKSTFVPVTYSSHKSTSSVTLYGNADYLCMKAYSETNKSEYFCIEIYSDSKRTKKILEYVNTFKKGTTYEDIFFDLTSLKSKTYYATSYVIKQSQIIAYGNNYRQDPATIKKFTITVKRDGTSIKNMKSFMYGYENTYYGPAIYWYSVPGATKYEVYKYIDKKYKKIATVKANGEEFSYYIDKSLKGKNTSAYYKVKALNGTGSTALSLNKVKAVTLKTPTVKTELLTNGIKVSWSKPRSSCTYVVLRSTNGGDWKQIKETKSTKYTDTEVTTGKTYYYTVVAYYKGTASGYDPEVEGRYYIAAPTLDSVKPADGKLNFKWKSIKKAESYNVYRKASGEKSWTKLANVKTAEYTDASIQRNKVYSYTVSAVIGKKQGLYNTKGISGAVIDTPVLNEIERTADGYAKISWNKIDGVSYKVYRKTAESGWEHIKSTSSTEYVDKTDLINGKEYYYTVKAYISSKEGSFDETGKPFICLEYLEGLKPYGLTDGIGLEWLKVENAESYNVYRKIGEEDFTLIGSTQELFYEDVTAQPDIAYTYKVAYVMSGAEQSAYSCEIPANLVTEGVELADSYAVLMIDGNWVVKLAQPHSEVFYKLYRKTESGLVNELVSKKGENKIFFASNSSSAINEYYLTSVCSDGTVTAIPEKGFVLETLDSPVLKVKADHQNYSMKLSWNKVEGAEKYLVYKGDELLAMVDGLEYTDAGLKADDYYTYSISAVKNNSARESESKTVYLIKKPKVKIENVSSGIKISWDKCGVTYDVYRKAEGATKWTLLKNVTDRSYTDKKVTEGKKYIYTVAARWSDGEKGGYDENGVGILFVKPTKITKATYYSKTLQIAWEKSSSADYYEVYRKAGSGSWKLVYKTKSGKTVKYKDTDVKSGTKYQYSVKVINDGYASEGAKITRTFLVAPKKITAKKVDSGIKISFSKVTAAQSYYVYRKGSDGKWKELAKVKNTSTSYTDKTAKKGATYSYYVKTYNNKQFSYQSSTVKCKR